MKKNKQCLKCNSLNAESAKFCENCGTKLRTEAIETCKNCNAENTPGSKFCYQCGNALHHASVKTIKRSPKAKHLKKSKPTTTKSNAKPIILVASLLAIISIIVINKNTNPVNPNSLRTMVENKSTDKVLEATVLDVAAKFICSCGTCERQSLDICTCDVAKTERQFIRSALQTKQDPEKIIVAVNERYGWIKEQYKEKYGPGKLVLDLDNNLPFAPELLSTSKENIKLANAGDRLAIISSFSCTCGQCEIDELKDCNCSHPGGATEVKSFIDQKIQENKYTKENIIHLVEGQYGARIR